MDDDKADDKPVEETPVEEPELSQTEKDAVESITDVKGEVTDNEDALEVEEPVEDKEDDEPEETNTGTEGEPEEPQNPDVEEDPEGVYKSIDNPGDFQPGDYSFEVKTADGKVHKITTPEDVDAFAARLDDNPESITASQFSVFNRKAALMEQGIATDKKAYETDKTEFDKQAEMTETRETSLKQWNNEINYLSSEGKLPEISDANNKADWSDAEVAKDPAVAARLELLQWMSTENDKRMKVGLEPMTSLIDAFNNRRLEQMESSDKETKKTELDERRKAGAKINGRSPFQPENIPKDSIVGVGGSLNDLVRELDL